MLTPSGIKETTITVGNVRINISEAGLWMDMLNDKGEIQSSTALAWEELTAEETEVYLGLALEIEPLALTG